MATSIPSNLAYFSNGYYYTTDGEAIPAQTTTSQSEETVSTQVKSDSFEISAQNEMCTDGNDDGKIGFCDAVTNFGEGIGRTFINGIRGMVFNGDGSFNLGKTLLSAGTIVACAAFPALIVPICAVGAIAGGKQLVDGINAASQATTDAEAKAAWQNIGGGAFTVASSVAGVKGGIKAVKATSTAGIKSAGKIAETVSKANSADDAASALKSLNYSDEVINSVKSLKTEDEITNALSSLKNKSASGLLDKKNATFGQKTRALGQDMMSSTQNRYTKITGKSAKNTTNKNANTDKTPEKPVETETKAKTDAEIQAEAKARIDAEQTAKQKAQEADLIKEAKRRNRQNRNSNVLTEENKHSPQAKDYELADQLTDTEVQALKDKKPASRVEKFNQQFNDETLLSLQKRISKHEAGIKAGNKKYTEAGLTALKQQLENYKLQLEKKLTAETATV